MVQVNRRIRQSVRLPGTSRQIHGFKVLDPLLKIPELERGQFVPSPFPLVIDPEVAVRIAVIDEEPGRSLLEEFPHGKRGPRSGQLMGGR